MSGAKKVWDDAAVKDLTFAILMSTNPDGNVNIAANWDRVTDTMTKWGYGFTKSAMNQHWSKKVFKEFKERHAANGEGGPSTPSKATPRKRGPNKTNTPGTGRGKKRAASEDADSPDAGFISAPIAQTKTPRSAAKKLKREENGEAQAEEVDDSLNDEDEVKGEKEDSDYAI